MRFGKPVKWQNSSNMRSDLLITDKPAHFIINTGHQIRIFKQVSQMTGGQGQTFLSQADHTRAVPAPAGLVRGFDRLILSVKAWLVEQDDIALAEWTSKRNQIRARIAENPPVEEPVAAKSGKKGEGEEEE